MHLHSKTGAKPCSKMIWRQTVEQNLLPQKFVPNLFVHDWQA